MTSIKGENMSSISTTAQQLCLERDAHRCRHCGKDKGLVVVKLVPREGPLSCHLSNLVTQCKECNDVANELRNSHSSRVGVVLCGGRGTRLYPLTMHQNKHTLPIGLVPMVFYPIKTLQALGVKRALIVVDREGANSTMGMLGSGKAFGMDFTYKIQEGAGGISDALYLAKDFVGLANEIVCILGDNIFDNKLLDNVVMYPNQACVWIKEVDNPSAYGVATIDTKSGKVQKIVEKPSKPETNLAVVGLYMYTSGVFDVIDGIEPSERGELEISSVNNYYAEQGTLEYSMVNGYWGDAGGSIQRYAECSMHGAKEANVSAEEIDSFRSIVFDDK